MFLKAAMLHSVIKKPRKESTHLEENTLKMVTTKTTMFLKVILMANIPQEAKMSLLNTRLELSRDTRM